MGEKELKKLLLKESDEFKEVCELHQKYEKELDHLLTPIQRNLFRRMSLNDQRHSINVCATLREAGTDESDLLVAALLHDVGKAAGRIWLWQRTLIVLLKHWAPALLSWVARGSDQRTVPWWRKTSEN